jgi:hypothetical protein
MTMKKPAFSLLTLLLAAIATLTTAAHADTIDFVITNSPQTGTPGSTLTFDAMMAAPPKIGSPIFLNALEFNLPSPLDPNLIDATDFFVNFPLSLNGGDSVTDALFAITLPAGIAPGKYISQIFVLGGVDVNDQTIQASSTFEIDVPGSTSPIPEPGTWVLLVTGAGSLARVVYRRHRSTSSDLAA